MIELPPLWGAHAALWGALAELAGHEQGRWALVGGQMVMLHALQAGRMPVRVSADIDVIADVRAAPGLGIRLAGRLVDMGFVALASNPDGIAQRFTRGAVSIDLLAPDGLGPRTDIRTLIPAVSVPVPGGTFALTRARPVSIGIQGRSVQILVPDLVGALVIKSRAAQADRSPQRHLTDLVLLYALADDLPATRAQLSATNRSHLRAVRALEGPEAECWSYLLDAGERRAAQAAHRYLTRP